MRSASLTHRRATLPLFALAIVSLAGCFRSPDMTKLSCTTAAHCPAGYQCTPLPGKSTGICQKAVDAAGIDVVLPVDVVIGIDVSPSVDLPSAVDITISTFDTSTSPDGSLPTDKVVMLDTTHEVSVSPDHGADVAPDTPILPDAEKDTSTVVVDVAPDLVLDAASPAPDLGPDLPATKLLGASCTLASECGSNACVDGVCCENGCAGTCMACSAAKTGGSSGRCLPISVGTDPDVECSLDTGNPCGRDGTCDGLGACRMQVLGTSCGSPSCSGGMLTSTGKCNGGGNCVAATSASPCPGNLLCATSTTCTTTCTDRSVAGCPSGYKCVNGTSCVLATVDCGGTSCAVANGGGGCCATDPSSTGTNAVLTCLAPSETCSTGSLIPCNSGSECPVGQICCAKGNNCKPGTWDLHCQANPSDCMGGTGSWGYQVCDPSLSPTECLSGTCKASSCLPGVYACSQ
jgi:hypothetical protein